MFEIVDVEDAGHFLSVVCGGVALYTRIIKMTDVELASFKEQGGDALRDVVYDICKGDYTDREWQDDRQAIYKKA